MPSKSNPPLRLALALLVMFAAAMAAAAWLDLELFRAMGYALVNMVVGVAGYYWGASQSSDAKDEMIGRALSGSPKGPAADV